MRKFIFLPLIIGILSGSCVSTSNGDVKVTEPAFDDEAYYEVYKSHTKDYDVVQNFLTNFTISTTLLDREFVDAFSVRYEKIYKEKHNLIMAPKSSAAYFISVYSPERRALKIQSKDMWNIYLLADGKRLKPAIFKRIRPKAKWSEFFPVINFWSHEFLIVFELPEDAVDTDKRENKLVLAGPKGQINFQFTKD